MTHLEHIQARTESNIDASIKELNALLVSVKTDLQLSSRDKVHKIAILTANLNAQTNLRRQYNALMNDVPVKF